MKWEMSSLPVSPLRAQNANTKTKTTKIVTCWHCCKCRVERKRKKEATLTAAQMSQRALWEQTILRNAFSSCEHVLVLPRIPQEGPAVSFMNSVAGEGFFNKATRFSGVDPLALCSRSLSAFPRVRKEESERSLAIDLLLRFVRNVFFHDSGG